MATGNMKKLSRDTGIPYRSVIYSIEQAKAKIKAAILKTHGSWRTSCNTKYAIRRHQPGIPLLLDRLAVVPFLRQRSSNLACLGFQGYIQLGNNSGNFS